MAFRPDLDQNLRPSIATRPGREVRGLELPPPGKTIQDMEPRPPKKRLEKGKLAWSAAAGILIGINLAPKVQEYVDNPDSFNPQAIMRDITSFPGVAWNKVIDISKGFNWFKEEPVIVPDTFDPTAKKGVIGENNSVNVPLSEAKTEVNNEKASVPLIIRLPEGYTGNINYQINSFGLRREGQLINDQLVLSNLPVGTEIISPWDGKINQGSGRSPVFSDGSLEDLQAKIRAQDENGNEFSITLSTGRVRNVIDSPNAVGYPVLENDSVPATNIKKGDVLAVIASTGNSKWFEGQVSLSIAAKKGAVDIQIATQDGKAIALQGSN